MASFVLCRREIQDIGAAVVYCAKPITTKGSEKCDACLSRFPIWPTNDDGSACSPDQPRFVLSEEIKRELYLYHCAGGHTRAQMAEFALEKAGFRFERNHGEGPSALIYWPDGIRLTYTNDGQINYSRNPSEAR